MAVVRDGARELARGRNDAEDRCGGRQCEPGRLTNEDEQMNSVQALRSLQGSYSGTSPGIAADRATSQC